MNIQQLFTQLQVPHPIFSELIGGDGGISRESALEQIKHRIRVQSTHLSMDSRCWSHSQFQYVNRWPWLEKEGLRFEMEHHMDEINKSCRRHGFRAPWDGSLESAHLPIAETQHSLPMKYLRLA